MELFDKFENYFYSIKGHFYRAQMYLDRNYRPDTYQITEKQAKRLLRNKDFISLSFSNMKKLGFSVEEIKEKDGKSVYLFTPKTMYSDKDPAMYIRVKPFEAYRRDNGDLVCNESTLKVDSFFRENKNGQVRDYLFDSVFVANSKMDGRKSNKLDYLISIARGYSTGKEFALRNIQSIFEDNFNDNDIPDFTRAKECVISRNKLEDYQFEIKDKKIENDMVTYVLSPTKKFSDNLPEMVVEFKTKNMFMREDNLVCDRVGASYQAFLKENRNGKEVRFPYGSSIKLDSDLGKRYHNKSIEVLDSCLNFVSEYNSGNNGVIHKVKDYYKNLPNEVEKPIFDVSKIDKTKDLEKFTFVRPDAINFKVIGNQMKKKNMEAEAAIEVAMNEISK